MESGPVPLKPPTEDALLETPVWAAELGAYEWDVGADTVRWLNDWCQRHDIDPCDGEGHSVRWRARVHPDDRAAALKEYEAHLAGRRERYESEYRIETLGGRWLWVRNRAHLVRRSGRGGRQILMGVCQDVDQRRRLEVELERSRRNLEALAAAAPVWMMLLDPDGTIEFANRSVRGIDPGALVGRRILSLVRNLPDAPALEACLTNAVRTRTPQMITITLDDGRTIGTWATPIVAAGRVTGIASVSADLSERRSRERDLLEAVAREQRRFRHDLHDGLGQELTGVALLVKTLARRAAAEAPSLKAGLEEVLDYVTGAIATSREVARGVSPADLENGGLSRALQELVRRWPATGVFRIDCRIEPGAGAVLEPLAAENLYRIAQESLSNAVRHAGASEIRLRLEDANAEARGGVRLIVEDDGQGIRAGEAMGPGLGLRIMRARAELIGATLRIGGRSPRGTRIECLLEQGAAPRPATAPRRS